MSTLTPPKLASRYEQAALGRPAGTTYLAPSSPQYTSAIKRYSLYGTEDRVVIDPGSRIWKVGFSGEPKPRAVFYAADGNQGEDTLWTPDIMQMIDDLERSGWSLGIKEGDELIKEEEEGKMDEDEAEKAKMRLKRSEAMRLLRAKVLSNVREIYSKHLVTESKSRKVMIIENAFLPTPYKYILQDVLISNFHVPSVSFTNQAVLALMASGRTTGLVVDFGYHETTIIPVFQTRIINSHIVTTPTSSSAFFTRLKLLLLHHATLTPFKTPQRRSRAEKVDESGGEDCQPRKPRVEELTRDVLEDIRSRGCFVGGVIVQDQISPIEEDTVGKPEDERFANRLEQLYRHTAHPDTVDASFTIPLPSKKGERARTAVLEVPGWVRERAAEAFFEVGDEDRLAVQEAVLKCLTKLPIDLRAPMIGSILCSGGGCMLPSFIPRFRISLLQAILASSDDTLPPPTTTPAPPPRTEMPPSIPETPSSPSSKPPPKRSTPYEQSLIRQRVQRTKTSHTRPYSNLASLSDKLSILNDPDPIRSREEGEGEGDGGVGEGKKVSGAGSAPAWNPHLLSWIGGSLAGALQIGGETVHRPSKA